MQPRAVRISSSHHHRPHHSHHHNGLPLAGLLLGGLAIGTAAALATPAQTTTYVVTSPPPPPLSDQEIAERNERRRIAEERRRLEEAERQAAMERRIAESNRIRIETERAQDEKEAKRVANFQAHQQLIDHADTMPFDTLQAHIAVLNKLEGPIARFRHTPYKDLPESKSRNLLGCILFNPQLTSDNKYILLNTLLFTLGYTEHYLKLFQIPLFDAMVNDPRCFELLAYLYNTVYLQTHQNQIGFETERTIWSRLIHADQEQAIRLFRSINTNDRRNQLLADWIHSKTTATEVINTYQTIKIHCGLSSFTLDGFYKMAKQHILKLEIMRAREQPGMELHPNEDENQIRHFLSNHRNAFMSCMPFLFSSNSAIIDNMIRKGKIPVASQAWQVENKKEEPFLRATGIRP